MRSLTVLSLAALALVGSISAQAREPRLGAVLSVPVLNHSQVTLGVTPRGQANLRWRTRQGPLTGSLAIQRPSRSASLRSHQPRRHRTSGSVGLHLGGGASVFVSR